MADKIFLVEARIKNARLIAARKALGFASTRAVAEALHISQSYLCALETLRVSPCNASGAWTGQALRVACFYGHPPEFLWPPDLAKVHKRKIEVELSHEEVSMLLSPSEPPQLPEDVVSAAEMADALRSGFQKLPPIKQGELRRYFAEGKTQVESADPSCVGQSRAAVQARIKSALFELRLNVLRALDCDLEEAKESFELMLKNHDLSDILKEKTPYG